MGMYGERDVIVNPNQWKPLQDGIPHAQIKRFKNAGHFIMLDEPTRFKTTLEAFLAEESPKNQSSPSLE
jgi:pimeloyl-ACP methyl ester carboxylesterase